MRLPHYMLISILLLTIILPVSSHLPNHDDITQQRILVVCTLGKPKRCNHVCHQFLPLPSCSRL